MRKLNYNRLPGTMFIPDDCNDIDWTPCDPLPGLTQRAALPPETARKVEQGKTPPTKRLKGK
jgi:hypothetical protein